VASRQSSAAGVLYLIGFMARFSGDGGAVKDWEERGG